MRAQGAKPMEANAEPRSQCGTEPEFTSGGNLRLRDSCWLVCTES